MVSNIISIGENILKSGFQSNMFIEDLKLAILARI